MLEIVSLILGPPVVAGIIVQLFKVLGPGRVSERVNALKDELEALRAMDDGTSLGKAAYAVSRADVLTATINRLSSGGGRNSLGLLVLSMSSFVFVALTSSIAHPSDLFEHLLLWSGLVAYSIFVILSLIVGILTAVASAILRAALSTGFRKVEGVQNDELRDAFDGLRSVFRPVSIGEDEHYRLRPLYQYTLSQSARTRVRSFMRELDCPVID
ncbi:hypothetical protein [Brevibacterium sp. UCMA 11752]|uniref:hypothetical protein n=1 Tax=Brevibacterium sp. UCMA 11752 TaxID=2745946 RepID=UPI001F1E2AA1|nr:hypothetical protein [Brevibacterium sp. UCMA 11752]MCF2587753.1 hypothetical protein [Brevibacterium sp. UCMA 11752]